MKPARTVLLYGLLIFSLFLSSNAVILKQAWAQDSDYQESTEEFSQEELAQMLAPIALYPDALLSQVLMASTYPIEVIEAERWIKQHPELKDEQLDEALLDKEWDPSVKALCHFPSILALMSDNISETVKIGNTFLAQEDAVMDMVQELRNKAYARGNLVSSPEQNVVIKEKTIIIEPANPRVIYVPYYDPLYIYGPWWYPAYPPYYWGPSGISIGFGISYWPAFYFGFAFGTWSYVDWPYHHIYIDVRYRPRYIRHDHWPAKSGRWDHQSEHRRGVAYRNKSTAQKYGQQPRYHQEYHQETRGFPIRRERKKDIDRREIKDRAVFGQESRQEVRNGNDRQSRQNVERDRQKRRVESPTVNRARVENDRPGQESTVGRVRSESDRPKREDMERERRTEQLSDRQKNQQQELEVQQDQKHRENVFNRIEDGNWERRSSKRGWQSRQGGSSWRDRTEGNRDNERDWNRNRR